MFTLLPSLEHTSSLKGQFSISLPILSERMAVARFHVKISFHYLIFQDDLPYVIGSIYISRSAVLDTVINGLPPNYIDSTRRIVSLISP